MSAVRGAQAWAAYGVVELFFLALLPWVASPGTSHERFHIGFSVLIIGLYAVVGTLLASVAAIFLRFARTRVDADDLNRVAAALSLAWVFGANMALAFNSTVLRAAALAMPAGLTLALIAACYWTPFRWLFAFARPWTLSITLVGFTWIASRAESRLALAFCLIATLLAAILLHRRLAALNARVKTVLAVAISAVVLVLAGMVDPSPPLSVFGAVPRAPASGPNVLLVSLDTVRADHLSVYGYERDTSPNLKTFAGDATLYRHSVSAGAMTLTSHASMFTGLYGARHGAHCSREAPAGRPLDDRFTTLAEALGAKGYSTAAVIANTGYLGAFYNFTQGFDFYDATGPTLFLEGPPRYLLRACLGDLAIEFLPYSKLMRWTRDAGEINRQVFRLLERLPSSKTPFFLFVNYMDAHRPYLSPAPYKQMFPGKDPNFGARQMDGMLHDVLSGKRGITTAERSHLTSQYDGAVAYLDRELGGLFSRMKQLGLYDNTLIIVTGDHGEAFGDRNLVEHGSSVYQDQVGVPLIIRYPGQRGATVVEQRTSGVDIFPTVLDALGISLPAGLHGRSVRNLPADDATPILAESYAPGVVMDYHPRFRRTERALFLGKWKFVDSRNGRRELYDLSTDPAETRNFYGTEEPLQKEMERLLAELSVPDAKSSTKPLTADPATMERLKGLGYIK